MADPGLPGGGNLLICKIFDENWMKMKEIEP